MTEEEDDELCCRVCHGPAETDQPLYHPCKCSGSIKWVHQDCLMEWLRIKGGGTKKCELCRQDFKFTPLYAKNAPVRLSLFEFVLGLFGRLLRQSGPTAKYIFIVLCWFTLLPVFTVRTSKALWATNAIPLFYESGNNDTLISLEEESLSSMSLIELRNRMREAESDLFSPELLTTHFMNVFQFILDPSSLVSEIRQELESVTSRESEAEEALEYELRLEREHMGKGDNLGQFESSQKVALSGILAIIQMMELLADCLGGTVLCVVIVTTTLMLLALRDVVIDHQVYLVSIVDAVCDTLSRNMLQKQNQRQAEQPAPAVEMVNEEAVNEPPAPVVEMVNEEAVNVPPAPAVEMVNEEAVNEPPAPVEMVNEEVEMVNEEVVNEPPALAVEMVNEEAVNEPPAPVVEMVNEEVVNEPPAPVVEMVNEEVVNEPPAPVEMVNEEAVNEPPAPVEMVNEEVVNEPPAPAVEMVNEEAVNEPPAPVVEIDDAPPRVVEMADMNGFDRNRNNEEEEIRIDGLGELLGLNLPLRFALSRLTKLLVYNITFLMIFQFVPFQVGLLTLVKLGAVEVVPPDIQSSKTFAILVGYGVCLVFTATFYSVHTALSLVHVAQRHGSLLKLLPEARLYVFESFRSWSQSIDGRGRTEREVPLQLRDVQSEPDAPLWRAELTPQVPEPVVEPILGEGHAPAQERNEAPEVQEPFSLMTACYHTLKVSFVLFIDLVTIPCVLGCVVDVATFELSGGTLVSRASYAAASPLLFILIHWLLGVLFITPAVLLQADIHDLFHQLAFPRFMRKKQDKKLMMMNIPVDFKNKFASNITPSVDGKAEAMVEHDVGGGGGDGDDVSGGGGGCCDGGGGCDDISGGGNRDGRDIDNSEIKVNDTEDLSGVVPRMVDPRAAEDSECSSQNRTVQTDGVSPVEVTDHAGQHGGDIALHVSNATDTSISDSCKADVRGTDTGATDQAKAGANAADTVPQVHRAADQAQPAPGVPPRRAPLRNLPEVENENPSMLSEMASRPLLHYFISALVSFLFCYLPLILCCVYVPFSLGHKWLGTEPLRIILGEEELAAEVQLPMEQLIFHVLIPLAFERAKVRSYLWSALEFWVVNLCRCLGLTKWFLNPTVVRKHPRLFGAQVEEEVNIGIYHLAQGKNNLLILLGNTYDMDISLAVDILRNTTGSMYVQEYRKEDLIKIGVDVENGQKDPLPLYMDKLQGQFHNYHSPKFAWLRVAFFVVINMVALSVLSTLSLHLPLYLGRSVFSLALGPSTHFSLQHDIYALALGFAIALGFLAVLKHLTQIAVNVWRVHINDEVRNGGAGEALYDRFKVRFVAVMGVAKQWSSGVFTIAVIVISLGVLAPLLLGTIFREYIAVPFYVPLFETPAYATGFQNWAVGLVFLRLWIRIMAADDAVVDHLADMHRLMPLKEIVELVIIPTLVSLVDAWAGARVIGRVVCPLVFEDARYVAILQRASLFIYLAGKSLWLTLRTAWKHVASMHNRIRDERYLLGVTLNNLNQEMAQHA